MAQIVEDRLEIDDAGDPDAVAPKSRKLITQPYDLTVDTLLDQIRRNVLHLKPLSGRPQFQRRYVWNNTLASRLIESMVLNVPIPPCYFAQDQDFENEVIDGQQRLYSLYRFVDNQFSLSGLENLHELNGQRFHELDTQTRNRLLGYTLRCVVITNDSDEELRFDVFERLNSNTVPLNAQELRNCVFRGDLISLCGDLASHELWLKAFRRKKPDPRMRDEELILRYFAFRLKGLGSYRTPQKFWLNSAADEFDVIPAAQLESLRNEWIQALSNSVQIMGDNCFRREGPPGKTQPINKALVDLNMLTLRSLNGDAIPNLADDYLDVQAALLADPAFDDLISRAVDHKKRTENRFAMWNQAMGVLGLSTGI